MIAEDAQDRGSVMVGSLGVRGFASAALLWLVLRSNDEPGPSATVFRSRDGSVAFDVRIPLPAPWQRASYGAERTGYQVRIRMSGRARALLRVAVIHLIAPADQVPGDPQRVEAVRRRRAW